MLPYILSQQPKRIPSVSIWKCIEFDKSRYKNVIFLERWALTPFALSPLRMFAGSAQPFSGVCIPFESVNNPQVLLQPQTGLQSIHLWKKMYFQGIPWVCRVSCAVFEMFWFTNAPLTNAFVFLCTDTPLINTVECFDS